MHCLVIQYVRGSVQVVLVVLQINPAPAVIRDVRA
jgi:hypothetical protein